MTGVYLAYAIDQTSPEQREQATAVLDDIRWRVQLLGGWVYDPGAAFTVGPLAAPDPSIRDINSYALAVADVLVAYLPKGMASIGVPMEIERAHALGKRVLVVSDAPSWMLQYGSDNVVVLPEWGTAARKHLREAFEGISEPLGGPGPYSLPVALSEGAQAPTRAHDDDAGLDLVVSEHTVVEPGQFVDIPCGVSVALPSWSWGLIIGRSSTLRKRGLMVNQGVIDAGYRGPLFAGVWNLTSEPVEVNAGERVAQLLILDNGTRLVDIELVDQLPGGSRGHRGFGSTGV